MLPDLPTFAFLACLAVGGCVLIFQVLMGLLGPGDAPEPGPAPARSPALRSLAILLTFFGLGGLAALPYVDPVVALVVALLSAALVLLLVWALSAAYAGLRPQPSTRPEEAVGHSGTLLIAIPAKGTGRVLVNLGDRSVDWPARTDGPPLSAGSRVRVMAVVPHNNLLVSAAPDDEVLTTL